MNFNPIKILLLFYLLLSSGHINKLYSGSLSNYIDNNRYAQHLIGFITMVVLINLVTDISKWDQLLMYGIAAYILFILTTKLDFQWNLAIIILLFIGYLYEINLNDKEEKSNSDPNLLENDKLNIRQQNDNVRIIIVASILAVILIGSSLYLNKKVIQYGGNFDLEKFFVS